MNDDEVRIYSDFLNLGILAHFGDNKTMGKSIFSGWVDDTHPLYTEPRCSVVIGNFFSLSGRPQKADTYSGTAKKVSFNSDKELQKDLLNSEL